jgi:Animal haem peroxidase
MRLLTAPLVALAVALDHAVGWHRLRPRILGIVVLLGLRAKLRRKNLHLFEGGERPPVPPPPPDRTLRTLDGTWNDEKTDPRMGSRDARFGRNIEDGRLVRQTPPGLPSPRLISRELLARQRFIPAWTLNVLAAAWVQFEVHDWFSHAPDREAARYRIPLAQDDPWPAPPLEVEPVKTDSTAGREFPPTFASHDTHWWDGSQIYGNDPEFARLVRGDGGKVALDRDYLPKKELLDEYFKSPAGANFWVGLGLLHTVFMREHNAICEYLRKEEPTLSDEERFERARLINAAVMAKIHTVEWTPAVIAHPTTELGMRAIWNGLAGRKLGKLLDPRHKHDTFRGIPGSPTDHFDVSYSLTEEFVAVYRMHQLLPDEFVFRSVANDEQRERLQFPDVAAQQTRELLTRIGVEDAFYSLGVAPAGAIVLHNFPNHLRALKRVRDGTEELIDVATTDIVRIRESAIPRYQEFRRLFHRTPVERFEHLTSDPVVQDELRRVYDNRLEQVDLMVGLLAEPRPEGFAFGDTTFRVFLLMASRRLKSDRFFTVDYTPEVYTAAGLRWIEDASMVKILARHYPRLRPVLYGVENAFKPWPRVPSKRRPAY